MSGYFSLGRSSSDAIEIKTGPNSKRVQAKKATQVYHIYWRWSVTSDNKENDVPVNEFCTKYCDKFIYQLEDSNPSGPHNYHYQGYGHLITKRRPCEIKSLAISLNGLLNGIEIGAASTAGIEALKSYSMKDDTRVRGPYADKSKYLGDDIITHLYPWQLEVKDRCMTKPDNRTINLVVDTVGNTGKSAFTKHMAWKHGAVVMGWARTGDLLYLVSQMSNKDVYIFDLSRSKPADWAKDDVSSAMEGIKNGMFMSTKYECKMVLMKCPHVWVFSNQLLNLSSMSADRWKIWEINGLRELIPLTSARRKELLQHNGRNRDESPKRRSGSDDPIYVE